MNFSKTSERLVGWGRGPGDLESLFGNKSQWNYSGIETVMLKTSVLNRRRAQ